VVYIERGTVFDLEGIEEGARIVGIALDSFFQEFEAGRAVKAQTERLRAAWVLVPVEQRDGEASHLPGHGAAHDHAEGLRTADRQGRIDDVRSDDHVRCLRRDENGVCVRGRGVRHLERRGDVARGRVALLFEHLHFHASVALAQGQFAEFDVAFAGAVGRPLQDDLNLDIAPGHAGERHVIRNDRPRPGGHGRVARAHAHRD